MVHNVIDQVRTDILFFKGQNAAKHGDYVGSLAHYNRALEISPSAPWLYLHKSISLAKTGNHIEAEKQINLGIKLESKKHPYFMYLGIIHFDLKRYDQALDCFRKALELSPNNSLILCYISLINFIRGHEIRESLQTIKDNIIGGTNSEYIGRFLIHCEEFLFNKKDSVCSFEESISPKERPHALFENTSIAINEYFLKLATIFNSDLIRAHLYVIQGRKEIKLGSVDSAILNYRKALKLRPALNVAIDGLIQIFLSHGMYDAFMDLITTENTFSDVASLLSDDTLFNENNDDKIVDLNAQIFNAAGQLFVLNET